MTNTAPPQSAATPTANARRAPLFQPSSLEEYPNWRYVLANYLVREAEDQPPQHPDPWINDTAELLYVAHREIPDFEGTLRQRHIRDALMFRQQRALVVKVLECYLVGGFAFDEIVGSCTILRGTLEAYAAVFCDVEDHRRMQGWSQLQMNPLNHLRGQVAAIASVLQNTFFFGAAEGVAEAVDVLCRLEGPTFADGLPPQDTLEFLREFGIRHGLAQALLSRSKRNCELMQQFEESQNGMAPGTPMNPKAIDIGLQILRRVKITRALQQEIIQLQEFCRMVPQSAMHVDT